MSFQNYTSVFVKELLVWQKQILFILLISVPGFAHAEKLTRKIKLAEGDNLKAFTFFQCDKGLCPNTETEIDLEDGNDIKVSGHALYSGFDATHISIPLVKFVKNGKEYYTDARYVFRDDGKSEYNYYKSGYLENLRSKYAQVSFTSGRTSFYTHQEKPAQETTKDVAKEPTKVKKQQGVDTSDPEKNDGVKDPADSGDDSGIDLLADEDESPEAASEQGVDVSDDTKVTKKDTDKPSSLRPRPRPQDYEESLKDAIKVTSNKNFSEVYAVQTDKEGNKSYKKSNLDLKKDSEFKVMPQEERKKIGDEFYREVQYLDEQSQRRNILLPETSLVNADGDVLDANSALTKTELEKRKLADRLDKDKKKDPDSNSEKAKDSKKLVAGTCANQDYINLLTSSNPNCSLQKAGDSLVYSKLKKGDTLIAMKQDSKSCFKLTVDKEPQTNNAYLNRAISGYAKRRKDRFDEIAQLLQSRNISFVKQTNGPKANMVTSSCVNRLDRCTIAIGLEDVQPVNFMKAYEIKIPKKGLVAKKGHNLRLQIHGPSEEGYYLVKHLEGIKNGRSFLVRDKSVIDKIKGKIDAFKAEFPLKDSIDDYDDVFDKEKITIERPVLDIQRTNKKGELERRTVRMDPNAPFKAIYDMNNKYDYYNISCTEVYNPLKPKQSQSRTVTRSKSNEDLVNDVRKALGIE